MITKIDDFIKEALKDEIPTYMSDIIANRYKLGKEYLSMQVPKHTDLIPNVRVKVQEDNLIDHMKMDLRKKLDENIIKSFKNSDMYEILKKEPRLLTLLKFSTDNKWDSKIIDAISINSLKLLYSSEFRLPVTRNNDLHEPIFSNNKSNIAKFLKLCSIAFDDLMIDSIDANKLLNEKNFSGLRKPIYDYDDTIKKVKDSETFLYITDKPDDKLRMSISYFYDSCQNIYSGGKAGTHENIKLLANVFDPNSKVAYLILAFPFIDNNGNEHPFTPIARTIVRASKKKILFDNVYPNGMEAYLYNIINKYTELSHDDSEDEYVYSPIEGLPNPYMDRYKLVIKRVEHKIIADELGVDEGDVIGGENSLYNVNGDMYYFVNYEIALREAIEDLMHNIIDWFENTKTNKNNKVLGILEGVMANSTIKDFIEVDIFDISDFRNTNTNQKIVRFVKSGIDVDTFLVLIDINALVDYLGDLNVIKAVYMGNGYIKKVGENVLCEI